MISENLTPEQIYKAIGECEDMIRILSAQLLSERTVQEKKTYWFKEEVQRDERKIMNFEDDIASLENQKAQYEALCERK